MEDINVVEDLQEKKVNFINSLLEATEEGKLVWNLTELPREAIEGYISFDEKAYIATISQKKLRLVNYGVGDSLSGNDYFEPVYRLEILDPDQDMVLNTFMSKEQIALLRCLYEAVQWKTSGASDIINELQQPF